LSENVSVEPGERDPLAAFEWFLKRKGRSDGTQRKYLPTVADFLVFLGDRSPGEVGPSEIDGYLASWEERHEKANGRPPRRATVRGRICALRSFFGFLEATGELTDPSGVLLRNPARLVSMPITEQRRNDFLRPFEDQALLACPCSPSERIVLLLLRWTGLRVSEACALTRADIDLTPGLESVAVARSKTSAGVRVIPLVPQLRPELEAWLELLDERGLSAPSTPVLATSRGSSMSPSYVWRLVKRVAARAGVRIVDCTCSSTRSWSHESGCTRSVSGEHQSQVSPHTLRRTFGSYLLNLGLRLEVVSKLLGHSSTSVTEAAYAELLGATIRRELLAVLNAAA
jgi:integrase